MSYDPVRGERGQVSTSTSIGAEGTRNYFSEFSSRRVRSPTNTQDGSDDESRFADRFDHNRGG
jgi:hypothetical protein